MNSIYIPLPKTNAINKEINDFVEYLDKERPREVFVCFKKLNRKQSEYLTDSFLYLGYKKKGDKWLNLSKQNLR